MGNIVIPTDAKQGALSARVHGASRTHSTTRDLNLRSGMAGRSLPGRCAAANLGAPRAPSDPVGQIPKAGSSGRPVPAQRVRAV